MTSYLLLLFSESKHIIGELMPYCIGILLFTLVMTLLSMWYAFKYGCYKLE